MRHVQLRAFHHVAIRGGFSRAAEALNVTQPAISDQIRKLEEEFDASNPSHALARLWDAHAKGEILTGLVHLRPEKKSFLDLLHLTDTPLSLLGQDQTRPGREALEEAMKELM